MADYDVDLFVIGGGSGGVRAARIAAGHGARVMLAEEYRLGGTCVVRGCVPKKLFVHASRFAGLFGSATEFGWSRYDGVLDWPTLVAVKNREISRLEALYARAQDHAKVTVVKSHATIEDAHTVHLTQNDQRVRARTILIATGSVPELPPIAGIELGMTSDEVFDLERVPERLVIGGAGYIAIEFAGLFQALGADVTIVCRGETVLQGFDHDLKNAVAATYARRGIRLMLQDAISGLSRRMTEDHISVVTRRGVTIGADKVLLAFGRVPNTKFLGLDRLGVQLAPDGAVVVDARARTNIPSIFAIGDVTNRIKLTPVAIREGHAFADREFGKTPWFVDYSDLPTAIFSSPEIGTAGLTEFEARTKFDVVEIYKTEFRPLTSIGSEDKAMMKLVVNGRNDRVVGVHLFADGASEMIQLLAIALKAGVTRSEIMTVMAVHPTMAEELVTFHKPVQTYDQRLSV